MNDVGIENADKELRPADATVALAGDGGADDGAGKIRIDDEGDGPGGGDGDGEGKIEDEGEGNFSLGRR
jgi:hypothetical protein